MLSTAASLITDGLKCSFQRHMIPSGSLIMVEPSLDLTGTTEDESGPKSCRMRPYNRFESC